MWSSVQEANNFAHDERVGSSFGSEGLKSPPAGSPWGAGTTRGESSLVPSMPQKSLSWDEVEVLPFIEKPKYVNQHIVDKILSKRELAYEDDYEDMAVELMQKQICRLLDEETEDYNHVAEEGIFELDDLDQENNNKPSRINTHLKLNNNNYNSNVYNNYIDPHHQQHHQQSNLLSSYNNNNNNIIGKPQLSINTKKTTQCKFFSQGNCKAGEQCRFVHHETLVTSSTNSSSSVNSSLAPSPQQGKYLASPNTYTAYGTPQVTSPQLLVKTELFGSASSGSYCKFFAQGYCRNGEDCPFIHSSAEHVEVSMSTPLSPEHSYYHNRQPLSPTAGSYSRPSVESPQMAPFSISPQQHQQQHQQQQQQQHNHYYQNYHQSQGIAGNNYLDQSKQICPFYMKGECKFGDRCRNHHQNPNKKNKAITEESLRKFSTIPCKYYHSQGSCPFGDSCYYLHSAPPKQTFLSAISKYQHNFS